MLLIQSMRKLRKDLLAMNLTASVCILVVASLCCYGWPVKQYLCNDTFLKPRHTSAWLTPLENAQAVICTEYELPSRLRGWNLSYHQGGNGPWIPKVDGVVNEGSTLPAGCDIDQVHVLARHAERYPTADAGQRHLDLVYRLKNNSKPVHKSLAFVKHWNYFRSPGSPEFESLIRSGRYAGTTAAERTGELLRSRYGHLVNPNITMRFWSASSPRDIETAEHFALGFFGSGWNVSHISTLEIIPESPDRGANTLTPGKTCLLYQDDFIDGRHSGYRALDVWQRTFAESIKTRLAPAAPGFNFSAVDIYSMFEMCGFEIMVRGVSPWCNVFTNNDWLDFEYGRDLLHFYRARPGNKYAGAMGMLWLNAMLRNMRNESESAKSVYAAFVHDGDIIPVVAALGLLDEPVDAVSGKKGLLPSQHRRWDRNWRTSDVVPMGGRLVFERIKCHGRLAPAGNRTFVRLLINDGHMALTLGGSDELLEHDMALGDFEGFLDMKREELGDFRHVCGIDEGGPGGIDFLHQ